MSKEAQNVEIDDAVVDAITAKAVEALKKELPEAPTAEAIAEKVAEMQKESVAKKDIHDSKEAKEKEYAELSKEEKFAMGIRGYFNKNYAQVRKYNQHSAKSWKSEVSKADYQNITTLADGEALVPDPEFVAEIERLTDEYGVAARLATVRRTDRNSVTLLSGTNEVSFTKTGEATAQNAQKLTYGQATVALDKYIATLVFTSEILEDSAINLWQDATNEIARARAKLFDQLVFTDSTDGLLSASNGDAYKTHTVGSAYTDFDADDAMDSTYKVVSSARKNARFFMHPTVWNEIRQSKTGDGTNSAASYLFGGPGQTVNPNIDGYPVELVDVLPDTGDITANEAFAVFGDLSRIKIHVKRQLETKIFDAGTVADAGGTDYNLITQDGYAMRATMRVKVQTRFPGAFCIIGTGAVS